MRSCLPPSRSPTLKYSSSQAAFEAVLAHAAVSGRPSVLNYSLVGAGNDALDLAVGQVEKISSNCSFKVLLLITPNYRSPLREFILWYVSLEFRSALS